MGIGYKSCTGINKIYNLDIQFSVCPEWMNNFFSRKAWAIWQGDFEKPSNNNNSSMTVFYCLKNWNKSGEKSIFFIKHLGIIFTVTNFKKTKPKIKSAQHSIKLGTLTGWVIKKPWMFEKKILPCCADKILSNFLKFCSRRSHLNFGGNILKFHSYSLRYRQFCKKNIFEILAKTKLMTKNRVLIQSYCMFFKCHYNFLMVCLILIKWLQMA